MNTEGNDLSAYLLESDDAEIAWVLDACFLVSTRSDAMESGTHSSIDPRLGDNTFGSKRSYKEL
jgi:hypothetical protein